jgi:hypothetical protein
LNSEANLKDDGAALDCYLQIEAATKNNGSANSSGVQDVARILTKRGECDKALVTLHRVDIDQLRGHWRRSMLLALAKPSLPPGGRKRR